MDAHGFGVGEVMGGRRPTQCFSKAAQNNWGGCLLFAWVNLISVVGG